MDKLISRNSMSAKALVISQNAAINFIEGKKGNIFFACGAIERGYVSPALQKIWETATLDDIQYCECSKDGKTFVPCLMTVGDRDKYLKRSLGEGLLHK